MQRLTLDCPLFVQAKAGGAPRVEAVAYAGGVVRVAPFGAVAIDLAGADLSRPVPILADHVDTLDGVLGQGLATVEGGRLLLRGTLSAATEAGRTVLALARDGVALQCSIGFEPTRRERFSAGQPARINGRELVAPEGGLTVIRSGRLREVSILPLGADPETDVTIRAKGTTMTTEPTNQPPADTPDAERIQARYEAFAREFGDEAPEAAARLLKLALGGATAEQFEREALEAEARALRLRAQRAQRPAPPPTRPAGPSADPLPEALLLCHLGRDDLAAKHFGDAAAERARRSGLKGLTNILRAAWQRRADLPPPPDGDEALLRAAFSTADISNIVSGVQNKLLLDQWARLPMLSLRLARRLSAKDFNEARAVRLTARDVKFTELSPDGEIQHGWLDDDTATFKVDTYARMFSVTRQDLINDDLGALEEMPAIIARGAGLKLESLFWSMVLANTGGFFSTGHGNHLTDALDADGLAKAVRKMRDMTDADGEPILVEPRYLVVPPALEETADQLFASLNVVMVGTADAVTTRPSANIYGGKYEPVVVPHLGNARYPGASDTGWYLFSDPRSGVAAFGVAFLNGQTAPTVEQSAEEFNTLGIRFRGYLDMGVCQLDHHGAVFSTGAGG